MITNDIHLHRIVTWTLIETMHPFKYDRHALTCSKCVLQCCNNFPSLVIPGIEYNSAKTNMCPTINLMYIYFYHGVKCRPDGNLKKKC